jgi:hypothetical protein
MLLFLCELNFIRPMASLDRLMRKKTGSSRKKPLKALLEGRFQGYNFIKCLIWINETGHNFSTLVNLPGPFSNTTHISYG